MQGAKGVIISITGGEDMRLMEVDEAASHIKDLVDPDANIIWGSAFNNDLGGKIRVSVVATGIDVEAGALPQPGKVFAFPAHSDRCSGCQAGRRGNVGRSDDEAPLELGSDEDTEELMLDSDDILTSPVGAPPIAPPEDDEPSRKRHAEATAAGGTLFERMSNIARGAPKAQLDEDEAEGPGFKSEPIDIPRFLNRQNNQ